MVILHRHRFDRREQLLRTRAEQARAGHGRERDGDLELWIILPAGALPRVGPAVVEHIFALAVGLEIGGRRRNQMRRLVLDENRRRSPAGAGADAARILERREKGVADEWIAAREPVPGKGVQPGHARGDLRDDVDFAVGHSFRWVSR